MRTYQQMADLMCHHMPQKPSRASIRFMVEFLDGITPRKVTFLRGKFYGAIHATSLL